MRIALIVDNPFRDLPGLVLVALHLSQKGGTCFLVPAALRTREVLTLAPDFVLLNNLRTDKEAFVGHLMRVGIAFGVLDTEGGVFRGMEQYEETLTRQAAIRDRASCFCSWGPKLASHAAGAGWYRETQIRVTGAPRMDFYAAPWREAALRMPWSGDVPPEPLVLINSNFSLANPMHRTPEEAAAIKTQNWGFDPERVARLLKAERQTMSQFVALTNRLAAALPQVNFVYRPHPFEDPHTYENLLERLPNLRLVKTGTVDGWILRSRAVIQRGCSTAIEAAIAGIPALSPGWIPAPVDFETVDAVSISCSSEEEMLERIGNAVRGNCETSPAIAANLCRVVQDWFLAVDGEASQRVADAVLQAVSGCIGSVPRERCLDALDGLLQPDAGWTARLRAIIRRALRLPVDWSFREWRPSADLSWDRDQRYFDASVVRSLVEAIEPVARKAAPQPWIEVGVAASLDRGDYCFHCRHGRSVTLGPARN